METFCIKKAFKHDGLIRQLLLAVLISLAVGIYLLVSKTSENFMDYIFIGLAGISIILITVRILFLTSFKPDKIEQVEATVFRTYYYRGTKRIKFSYKFQGTVYSKTNMINYSKSVKDIDKDTVLEVFVKTDNPKAALIKEFYFAKESL